MRFTPFAVAVLGALGVSGAAIEKRQSTALTDAQILNFALVLEHLESQFYQQGLARFDAAAFTAAGYGGNIRSNLAVIGTDEQQHVSFLSGALSAAGATPVQACSYNFGFNSSDVNGFLATSQILEGVGVSAYLGAAQFVSNKAYLTAAASILTAEARHSSFIRYINGYSGFVTEDIPLTPKAVTSLAAPFFGSCPNGSAPPFTPFPSASFAPANATAGSRITVTVANGTATNGTLYCTFLSGLGQAVAPYANNSCTIPTQNITRGQGYGMITRTMGFSSDSDVVAGPFILQFDTRNNTRA